MNKRNDINNQSFEEQNQNLHNLFKEVQDIRYGRAKAKVNEPEKKETIKFNKVYVVDHRFNAIGAVIGILFVVLFTTTIHSNSIFASTENEKVAINEFEKNNDVINVMDVLSTNISELTKKEIVTNNKEVDFEIERIDNDQLPKDEEMISQEGKKGTLEQTIIRTFENNQLISENIINESMIEEPVKQIVQVGTSEFLSSLDVHINDKLYTNDQATLYSENDEDSLQICNIYKFIDVIILEEKDGWAKISIDEMEGYVKSNLLTSEKQTPGIVELSRIQRILVTVSDNMAINVPSGLTKDDFIKVLSNHNEDKNKIFENNAELFYNIEQKYNINGLFVAALGIHESNWGTSNIATTKKNLFGYGSYDSSAYTSSYTFESYEYGIDLVSKVLVKYYINPQGISIYDGETSVGSYYNGPTIGGVNKRYASDQNWSTRIYSIMVDLYKKLY